VKDHHGEGWDPPKDIKDEVEFHWFKLGKGRRLLLGVLSPRPLWYVGHFHERRMRKCEGAECRLCALGVGKQLRFVFGAVEVSTGLVGIMEVGSSVAAQLKDWVARTGCFRGMLVEMSKPSSSKHSRTELEYKELADPPVWLKHPAPDLAVCLRRTWARQEEGLISE
jgi:hypothetical protein